MSVWCGCVAVCLWLSVSGGVCRYLSVAVCGGGGVATVVVVVL